MMDKEIRKEFASFCWGLTKVNDKWEFWWKLLEKNEPKMDLFKKKMEKLVYLLNENDTLLLQMDIEEEIWDLL